MKKKSDILTESSEINKTILVEKKKLLPTLDDLLAEDDIEKIRAKLSRLKSSFVQSITNGSKQTSVDTDEQFMVIPAGVFLDDLDQMIAAQSIERTHYYINRLRKGISQTRTSAINEINLNRWKEYGNVLTDSLWLMQRRDSTGLHSSSYWGNFIPQIPHQLMLRYTKKGDWVVDTFAGSGTTLLECQRLQRNGIGVELQSAVAKQTKALLKKSQVEDGTRVVVETGDSTNIDFKQLLRKQGAESAQLLIMHPPYHDIIKFSENKKDLSNASSTEAFVEMFGRVVDNTYPILQKGRYCAVVIGDKYLKGEWIPLGFLLMQEVLKRGYMLKSVVVKNFEETLGKRNQKELWRYRALAGGFYVFKHEYIFIFRK